MKYQNHHLKFLLSLSLTLSLAATAPAAVNHWNGSAGDQSWSSAGNWDLGTIPTNGDDVLFDTADGQPDFDTNDGFFESNNIVDQNYTVSSITYSNWTYTAASPDYLSQHTVINDGVTLTATNGLLVGVSRTDGKGFTAQVDTFAAISGLNGTFNVTGSNVIVGYQSSESALEYSYSMLDMVGLGAFSFVSPNGTFGIASAIHRRQGGEVYLAQTNQITCSNWYVGIGATGVGSRAALLHFGQSNVVNAGSVIFGKDIEGHVDFPTNLTNPTLRIRGIDGSDPTGTVYMGWTTSTGSSWGFGTNDFTAGALDLSATNLTIALHEGDIHGATQHTIDAFLLGPFSNNVVSVQRTLTIGSDPGSTTTTRTSEANGTIDMQNGSFSAGGVVLATSRYSTTGVGTINVHAGSFVVQSNIDFAEVTSPMGSGTAYGNLNLDGGMVSVGGSLLAGGGTSFCAVTNATLVVGGQIGSPTNNFSTLILSGGTLQLAVDITSNASAYIGDLDIEAASTIVITNQNLVVGQFPIISYAGVTGAVGTAGLSVVVPSGVTASLVDNTDNNSVDLLVTGATPVSAQPVTGAVGLVGTNTISISGTGTPNQPYHLYTTTNLALPISQWTLIDTTNATAGGVIQFFDPISDSHRFYELGR